MQRSATTKRGAGHSPTQDSLQQTAATGRSRSSEKAPQMGLPGTEAGPGGRENPTAPIKSQHLTQAVKVSRRRGRPPGGTGSWACGSAG